ncbi:MAG: hypothetical protein LAO31_23250, partial [Acidobacteriia bacterium]|nr:hypothetical protein [Terriglobia bacterium]
SRWRNNGVASEDNRLTRDRAETQEILGWAWGVVLPLDTTLRCVTPFSSQVLADVRKNLGHDINFANQKDREALGNALVNHVRQSGGCDVAGDKAAGCAH